MNKHLALAAAIMIVIILILMGFALSTKPTEAVIVPPPAKDPTACLYNALYMKEAAHSVQCIEYKQSQLAPGETYSDDETDCVLPSAINKQIEDTYEKSVASCNK